MYEGRSVNPNEWAVSLRCSLGNHNHWRAGPSAMPWLALQEQLTAGCRLVRHTCHLMSSSSSMVAVLRTEATTASMRL